MIYSLYNYYKSPCLAIWIRSSDTALWIQPPVLKYIYFSTLCHVYCLAILLHNFYKIVKSFNFYDITLPVGLHPISRTARIRFRLFSVHLQMKCAVSITRCPVEQFQMSTVRLMLSASFIAFFKSWIESNY